MLNINNTVALVVDIQERLMPVLHQHDEFVACSVQLLTGLQALGVPILLTEQYPKGLGATVVAVKDVLPESVVAWEKTRFSAYTEDVQHALKTHQAQNVLVLGCETHICVLQTVLDLRAQGFHVYLPQECLTSRTLSNKENGLQQCRDAGAVISNVESVLFQLLQDAKHPVFKTISKLIV